MVCFLQQKKRFRDKRLPCARHSNELTVYSYKALSIILQAEKFTNKRGTGKKKSLFSNKEGTRISGVLEQCGPYSTHVHTYRTITPHGTVANFPL